MGQWWLFTLVSVTVGSVELQKLTYKQYVKREISYPPSVNADDTMPSRLSIP
jgi:hypothetical protein